MEIIPAIDLIDGKCVRLEQGRYTKKKIYGQDPVDMAKQMEAAGLRRLHLVDLDGAAKGETVHYRILEKIAVQTNLRIDFGGGISSTPILRAVFDAGAAMAAIGSMAVRNKPLVFEWISRFGPERIFAGADVRDEKIAIGGWKENTGLGLFDFISEYMDKGITAFFCTDISKDGLLQGPSTALYKKTIEKFPGIQLTASGGIASTADLEQLAETGCAGAIVGKALYENRISLSDLKPFIV